MKTEYKKIVVRRLPIEIKKRLQCLCRFLAALVKEIKNFPFVIKFDCTKVK